MSILEVNALKKIYTSRFGGNQVNTSHKTEHLGRTD